MLMSANLEFDGVFLDFLGFIPTMTHLFYPKNINQRFRFLLDPANYINQYIQNKTYIVHHIGYLRSLSWYEAQEHHFWYNLYNKDIYNHLEKMSIACLYPYAPYIINSNLKILFNFQGISTRQKIKYSHVTNEIRLFPQGTTVAHIKVYLKSSFNVEEIVDIENALKKDPIFKLTKSGATKLGLSYNKGYTLQQILDILRKYIWKTLYPDQVGTIDKTTEIAQHRIINPLGKTELTDIDTAALMCVSKEPKPGQITDCKNNRIKKEKLLVPNTIIAFGSGATLLYAPNTEKRTIACFRNNYSNVVEFCLLQDFILSAFKELGRDLFSSESALSALQSFRGYPRRIFGGHRKLYNIITKRTNIESKREKLEHMSEIYAPASLIIKQMEEPQSTLLTMLNNADINGDFEGGILTKGIILPVYNLGMNIKTQIEAAMLQIEQEELKMYPNHAVLQSLSAGILSQMDLYKTQYLQKYKNLVENLLTNKDQIQKNVDKKRQSGEKVPNENNVKELLKNASTMLDESKKSEQDLKNTDPQKPKSFFEKAKPFLVASVGAATAVLKALGYIPA